MPTDTRVDNRGASALNRFCQSHGLSPAVTVGNQIDHGQSINDDEVLADGLASPGDDLHRQTHATRIVASPFIVALVCSGNQEFVDEIALRTHDFNAVIACLSGELGTSHKCLYLFFHAGRRQLSWRKRCDR